MDPPEKHQRVLHSEKECDGDGDGDGDGDCGNTMNYLKAFLQYAFE